MVILKIISQNIQRQLARYIYRYVCIPTLVIIVIKAVSACSQTGLSKKMFIFNKKRNKNVFVMKCFSNLVEYKNL